MLSRMVRPKIRSPVGRQMEGSYTFRRIAAVRRRFGESLPAAGSLRSLHRRADSRRLSHPTAGSCTTSKMTKLVSGGCQLEAVMRVRMLPLPSPEHWGDWALLDRGIYFVNEAGTHPAIEFFDLATRKVSRIADLDGPPPAGDPGFSVSPDGRRIVFSQVDTSAVAWKTSTSSVRPQRRSRGR